MHRKKAAHINSFKIYSDIKSKQDTFFKWQIMPFYKV